MQRFLLLTLLLLSALPSMAKGGTSMPEPADTTLGKGVVTIYFCGTGITQKWWKGADAHSWNSLSGFWAPEHVATLFHEQDTSSLSLKYIVDGVGTGVDIPLYDMVAFGLPSLKSNPRGWRTCLNEATAHVDQALDRLPGNITLNIVGFSRGGVLAMWLARKVEREKRIRVINLLVFDPVPGDKKVSTKIYSLGEKVKTYVGIYANDERTWMFEPVIPSFESPQTKAWILRVPGCHETMVGNIQKDGHSIDYQTAAEEYVPALLNVSWVTKVIATEVLGSAEWGRLRYSWKWFEDTTNLDTRKKMFVERFNAMNQYPDYSYMRSVSFIPMNIYAYSSGIRGTGCIRCSLIDMLAKKYNSYRCAYLVEDGKKLQSIGLQDYIKELSADEVWFRLMALTRDTK